MSARMRKGGMRKGGRRKVARKEGGRQMTAALETARMTLRPMRDGDWQDLRAIHGDRAAMRTLSADGAVLPLARSQAMARAHAAHWAAHGFGLWHAGDRATGRFCGYAGVRHALAEGRALVELAYAVVPGLWRQGRAGELARAVVDHAFTTLPLEVLEGFTLTGNAGSRRVLEGTGFVFSHEGTHAGLAHRFYRLDRARWQRAQRG